MGEIRRLISATDGFDFDAVHVPADDARRGGLVLIHEIFGITDHIREVARSFAADGYEVLAPALFERRARGFQAGYDAEGVARGRLLSEATTWDEVAGDLATAIDTLTPPVFAVGYCWGGTAAWLAAARCEGLAAASCYYGRRIPELLAETPLCPVILHFGRQDATIPPAVIEAIGGAFPDVPMHLYEAGHGFASDRSTDYRHDPARLARLRTLQLFTRAGGGRGEV